MRNNKVVFWFSTISVYLFLIITSIILNHRDIHSMLFKMRWDWGLSLFLVIVFYTIISIKTVSPKERGARTFLGKIIDILESGPVFIPLVFCDLEKAPRLNIQSELPSDPENIFREDGPVPEGKFPPIRIPFGPPSEDGEGISKDDPLNARMTQEVVPVITWRVKNYRQFLTTIGSIEEAERQMEDMSIAMLMESFTTITPAVALKSLPTYNKLLKEAIDNKVDTNDGNSWGIDLIEAKIKIINLSHKLNEAIQAVPEATMKKRATIITAEGEKEKRRLEGEGSGEAEKTILNGRTDGLKKMVKELGVNGQEALGAETARGITNNPGQKTVIAGSGGFGDLIKTAGSIIEAVKPLQTEVSKKDQVEEEAQ